MFTFSTTGVKSTSMPAKIYKMATIIAAGAAIIIFALNLSDIEHPCVRVAAIVVSEMNERLSPKKDPPTTIAEINAAEMPVSAAIPVATGTSATIVPTLVPTAIEMKQAARNSPAKRSLPGSSCKVMLTVASIAPISFAVVAKAPARIKIQIIRSTFLCPAPCENIVTLSSILPLRHSAIAYTDAIRNAAAIGTL